MKFIIGVVVIVVLLVFGYSYFKKPSDAPVKDDGVTTNEPLPTATESEKYLVLSRESISEHKTATDCWLYIDDSVYVVTNFLQMHSGGPDKILPYCGSDATGAFKSRLHSAGAKLLLKRLYIGKLDEKVLLNDVDKVQKDDLTAPRE